jgi:hypothetical protein
MDAWFVAPLSCWPAINAYIRCRRTGTFSGLMIGCSGSRSCCKWIPIMSITGCRRLTCKIHGCWMSHQFLTYNVQTFSGRCFCYPFQKPEVCRAIILFVFSLFSCQALRTLPSGCWQSCKDFRRAIFVNSSILFPHFLTGLHIFGGHFISCQAGPRPKISRPDWRRTVRHAGRS